MRLRVAISVLLVGGLLGPAAAHGAVPPRSARSGSVTDCQRDTGDGDGAATFEARMRALPRTARMQLRFTLQARTPDRPRYASIAAPNFGAWVSAAPGTARYVYTKRVENLLAPASYRVKLRFRWLDATGKVIARDQAYSRPCRQPDPRADLSVRSLGVQTLANPARDRYVVYVRNTGRSTADPSSLEFTVAGTLLGSVPVASLAPGEGTLVSIDGPACAQGDELVALAD